MKARDSGAPWRVGLALASAACAGWTAWSYPLDGFDRTGIRRLLGTVQAQSATSGLKLPSGALLGVADVRLNLTGVGRDWDLVGVEKDPTLQRALDSIFASRDPSYGIAVIDVTDPSKVVWAGTRELRSQLPGSVGKLGVMVALFDGLRRAFPDLETREIVLRERLVVAEDWASGDPHTTPHYDPESGRNLSRTVVLGDTFNLAEWVDHMISASANSAGSTVWKEAMLLRRYGSDYPPTVEEEHRFFRETPKTELAALSLAVIDEPLAAAGIDLAGFRQGTMFTRAGSAKIPGTRSYATPKELVRILLRLEQGRLVDEWSSLEMKRYLYMTKKRYRYVYAPELATSAVYFKSGSFYKCRQEEGFRCRKYMGNEQNLMNSVAIVEGPVVAAPESGVAPPPRRYLVGMVSDVLRVNSAWDHSRLAAAIDQAVATRAAVSVDERGSEAAIRDAGTGE